MTLFKLLLQTLRYHWRTNLAVLLGVVAGAAVVGGALIVGDSVRGSLREMSLVRLGKIDFVLQGGRFFRESLADVLQNSPEFASQFEVAAPAIVLPGNLEKPGADGQGVLTRAGHVNIYGVSERAWDLTRSDGIAAPKAAGVILSHGLARQLNVKAGDAVNLLVELPASIPRDSLLGDRSETTRQIPFTVETVLDEASGVGRLGLYPDQQLPLNAFVSLKTLQERLGLEARRATRRTPKAAEARVNALFVSARRPADQSGASAVSAAETLGKILASVWQLADFSLRLVPNAPHKYVSLESERMILERTVSAAAERVAADKHLTTSPVLVYLANELSAGKGKNAYSMYSVIAGLDASLFRPTAAPPFGPFEYVGKAPESPVGEGDIVTGGVGEIVINDWLAEDLKAKVGDVVKLNYHLIGSHGELPEEQRQFKVRGIVKLDGTVAADRGLTPELAGITDANSLTEWKQPFPMRIERVTSRDEEYWDKYRATPKAFVTLKTAEHLWRSRYGDLTSFRVAEVPAESLADTSRQFETSLLGTLTPADLGLVFQPVKYQGLQAAAGTTDFGGLFFGFSFFLILSAMILIGLLFRLSIERRTKNIGLLLATGYSLAQVRKLLLAEGLIVVCVGGIAGIGAAVAYAAIMIHGLKTWWIGAIGTRFLDVYITPTSLVAGFAISICVAMFAVWWGLRELRGISVRGLLAGVTEQRMTIAAERQRGRRAARLATICMITAVALSIAVAAKAIPNSEAFSGFSWPTICFFVVGMSVLVAGLAALSAWLESDRSAAVRGNGFWGVARLGMRNAVRHRSRSVLTAGLLAFATFLIVVIAAAHRDPAAEAPDKNSGNGGFTLVAESSVPVLQNLNTEAGRRSLDLDDETSDKILKSMSQVIAFRMNPGENASCLNIYQTSQPTILGVPASMIQRGGFKFVDAKAANPWSLLDEPAVDDAIPVLGDMNTLMYSLHVGVGKVLQIRDEDSRPVKVRVVGMLDSSIFQGVLLMSEPHFQKLFPSRAGYRYFLIDTPPATETAISDLLESKIPGFDAERVSDRLAGFLAVQNTYLSTFQTLGGLGLLLGTIGLATVMLRNVLERRAELALLRAVGFQNRSLAWLVLWENALLLGWGLAVGTLSALLAMLPHVMGVGADVPWLSTSLILLVVFAVGMLAALLAVRAAWRTPVLATLRAE